MIIRSFIPIYLLCFTLHWMGSLNHQPYTVQSPDAIQVSGICFDLTTAAYLPIEAFAISGTKTVKVGQSDKEGKFFIQLPRSAQAISFVSSGYHTVTLPVSFVGTPSDKADFRLGIIMSKRDSVAVQQTHQLLISNDLPDNGAVSYLVEPTGSNANLPLLTTAQGNRVAPGGRLMIEKGRALPRINFEGARPGPYRIAASMDNGQVLVDKKFTVNEGLTFMEVVAEESALAPSPNSAGENSRVESVSFSSKIVYFDQSHYELLPNAKACLDSVAHLLLTQPGLVAQITGYTDHVGEVKLNLTLSEYRAKMVANYLKQRGVQAAQLRTSWKGGSSLSASGDSEIEKAKSRRVVLKFERP